jgi:predicted DNA-binding transcriptional regulator AlpA
MGDNSAGKRLVKTPKASEILGLSASQLAKLRVYGGGPEFIKLGASVLYEIDELEAWLASHRRRSTAEYRGGIVA